jgi:hypothetical protein
MEFGEALEIFSKSSEILSKSSWQKPGPIPRNLSWVRKAVVLRNNDALGLGVPAFAGTTNYTFTGPSAAKCPRRSSQASSTRLGPATRTQITKNSGHPAAFATKPAPEER